MNRDRIEGIVKQIAGAARERWGVMTSDSLSVVAGRCEQLAGFAQARKGREQERTARQLREFLHRNRLWNTSSRP